MGFKSVVVDKDNKNNIFTYCGYCSTKKLMKCNYDIKQLYALCRRIKDIKANQRSFKFVSIHTTMPCINDTGRINSI